MEKLGGEFPAQRLDAETREQWMSGSVAWVPKQQAETARIAHAQGLAAEDEIHMIVRSRGHTRLDDTQAPGHAQVHDERTARALEQKVFPAPRNSIHTSADDEARDISLHASAQIGIAYGDARDGLSENERLDAAASDLYFGKFWHGGPVVLVGPRKYT
jgi:hypothetical protein